jgi:prepilin-type N-terminal cleavage/methylation domain-containing protein
MSTFTKRDRTNGMHVRKQAGFTLIETMVAIVLLCIGLLSVAALMSQMVRGSSTSRYMSSAAMLASEKLEDLNRYASTDAAVAASPAGSLGADTPGYFDNVVVSTDNGSMTETYNGTVVSHKADGTVSNVAPAASPANMTFDRRWLIETGGGLPAGVRRVTVLVIATDPAANQTQFQTSMVRP